MAKDVAELLGYVNTNKAISAHCYGVPFHYPIVDNMGRSQKTRLISEPDLYRLIAHSKLPGAVQFERWIYEEVLPTIRKTGGAYLTASKAEELLADPKLIIGLAQQVIELQELRSQAEIARYEAVAQRDEAIRTKACISDRKTATAMQTAGALRKKVNKLEMQLGVSETYMTARAIPWLAEYFGKKMSRGAWIVVGQQLKSTGVFPWILPHK